MMFRVFKLIDRNNFEGGGDTGEIIPLATVLMPVEDEGPMSLHHSDRDVAEALCQHGQTLIYTQPLKGVELEAE
jgi:hypothetical protein